jgi:hypothetical protein
MAQQNVRVSWGGYLATRPVLLDQTSYPGYRIGFRVDGVGRSVQYTASDSRGRLLGHETRPAGSDFLPGFRIDFRVDGVGRSVLGLPR